MFSLFMHFLLHLSKSLPHARPISRHVGHDDMRQSSCRLDTQCRCDGAASLLDIPEGSPSAAGSPDCAFRLSASARTNSNVNECCVSCKISPPPHDRQVEKTHHSKLDDFPLQVTNHEVGRFSFVAVYLLLI